jgi:hypothetical protein
MIKDSLGLESCPFRGPENGEPAVDIRGRLATVSRLELN